MRRIYAKIVNILLSIRGAVRLSYNKKNGKYKISTYNTFENRSAKTAQMLLDAMRIAYDKIENSFKVKVVVSDYPMSNRKVMAYSSKEGWEKIIRIPDFFFIDWKETGSQDYDELCKKMVEMSKIEPENNTLFWIGSTKTHKSRETLCEISLEDDRIEAYSMDWVSKDGRTVPSKYVSLLDHTKYKYLIDMQGRGWSARTKVLMFSGRPLFLQDRVWKEYWYDDIEPFVHYIPVKEDLSDLREKLDWAEANPEKCREVAKNAQDFALKNLTRDAAVRYLANELIRMGRNE